MTVYFKDHLEFLREQYATLSLAEITDAFNIHFGMNKTKSQIKSTLERRKICAPKENGTHRGLFKPGLPNINRNKVGHERKVSHGFTIVRTEDDDRMKHRLVWEKHYGPVPEGYTVIFLDGDKDNFNIDNLELMSRSALLAANMMQYNQADESLKPSILTLAKLKAKIGERTK